MRPQGEWIRVSRSSPCPICQKPDWCNALDDGSVVHCMRVSNSTPSKSDVGGWIHKIVDNVPRVKYVKPIKQVAVTIDAPSLFQKWQKSTDVHALMAFAAKLGVEPMALHMIGCAWAPEHAAWAFPMRNGFGKIVGIRLRNESGEKWAVKGSKSGIFFPDDHGPKSPLYIVEGPTDCAAGLSLGVSTLGRPSCQGNEDTVNDYIKAHRVSRVVIIADSDKAGIEGATRLQNRLKVSASVMIVLPAKDIREFYINGGKRARLESLTVGRVWKTQSIIDTEENRVPNEQRV